MSVQNPIRIERYDEPQPDVALLTPRSDFYATAAPTSADILLFVEVRHQVEQGPPPSAKVFRGLE